MHRIQRNLTGSKISTPSTKFAFSGRSEKQNGRPGLWLAETFSTSPLKPLNGIQLNLSGSKTSTPSTKFVFFGPIGKTKWLHSPLIDWDIFDFSSETTERNSPKLDRKQDVNALYQVCVFRADRKKQDGRPGLWLTETFSTSPLKPLNRIQRNLIGSKISTPSTEFVFCGPIGKKMAALASDWLRHFRLLWNRWTEFNETWQEARSPCPLPSLCFSGRSEKQNGRPGLWLAETFSTSPLEPLNGIQRNLIGCKISTPSTKFVFFGLIEKNIMATLASDWLRHILTFPLKPLNRIQRNLTGSKILTASAKCVFFGPKSEYKLPPWPIH